MSDVPTIRTPRLLLRSWRDEDLAPFAALNADPAVMAFFPRPLDRAESDAVVARIRDHFARNGFGLWAVEAAGAADFIGFVGLAVPRFEARFTPCVEIGWRLASEHWGTAMPPSARAVLDFAFRELGLDEVVSFTAVELSVAGRHGADRDDPIAGRRLQTPALLGGHPLRRHVLYRIGRPAAVT